jgi:predicted dienelactone hydrolase
VIERELRVASELSVGCRSLEFTDSAQHAQIPLWVLYPTRDAVRPESFGPYSLPVAMDAQVEGTTLPVVVISHGNTGSPWAHRDLAARLAAAGFVVLLPEHIGNSRSDSSLTNTVANLINRPRHLHLALDAAWNDPHLGPRLAPGAAVIGHSIGAYTALAAAGGLSTGFPAESPDGQAVPIPAVADSRIQALVLLAPAAGWFREPGSLAKVDLPILLFTGDRDVVTPAFHADIVVKSVPDSQKVKHRIVPNAGHFSFQSPFPPAMTKPEFPPSQDPAGFDRVSFQATLAAQILEFLNRYCRANSNIESAE